MLQHRLAGVTDVGQASCVSTGCGWRRALQLPKCRPGITDDRCWQLALDDVIGFLMRWTRPLRPQSTWLTDRAGQRRRPTRRFGDTVAAPAAWAQAVTTHTSLIKDTDEQTSASSHVDLVVATHTHITASAAPPTRRRRPHCSHQQQAAARRRWMARAGRAL